MRLLSSIDWPVFFDRVSLVERVLREDPAGAYARDGLPHAGPLPPLDRAARQARQAAETDVARRAVELAQQARVAEPAEDRATSRRLLPDLARPAAPRGAARVFAEPRGSASRASSSGIPLSGTWARLPAAIALTVASLVAYANRHGATALELWIVAAAVVIPASELAISLINAILTSQIPPRQLPKLAMRNGIPASDRTFVVVPAIIDSESRMRSLFHDLEVRFLANQDSNLFFALLSDFTDADAEHQPGDEPLLRARRGARRGAQRAPRVRALLPVSPRAAVEPQRRPLDGLGAQARQAGGVQPAPPRRGGYELHRPAGRSVRRCARSGTSSRSTPTRSCRWTPRDGWSVRCRTPSTARASTPASSA